VVPVGLVVPVASAELVELVVLAALVGEIACPPCRVGEATGGNTIPSIAEGLPTRTERPRTVLAERRGATLSPSARLVPGNKLAGRAATLRVPAEGLE